MQGVHFRVSGGTKVLCSVPAMVVPLWVQCVQSTGVAKKALGMSLASEEAGIICSALKHTGKLLSL